MEPKRQFAGSNVLDSSCRASRSHPIPEKHGRAGFFYALVGIMGDRNEIELLPLHQDKRKKGVKSPETK